MRRPATVALALAALVAGATGCATAPARGYEAFVAANPRSILIVPVANRSVDVEAPDYLLSTLPVPVAERGYYVFPVNAVKRVLEDDGLADPFLVHGADPVRLAGLFGADAVLYVTIDRWDAQYMVISTTVTVELDYVLKDGRTGDVLWRSHRVVQQTPSDGTGGGSGGSVLSALVGAAVSAAVTRASPNYMGLARQANAAVLAFPGPGFPAGPFRPEYRRDVAPGPGAKPER